ncbi:MAG: acyl carrier protein [Clostridia bacterium]|nr:acyl carrier protein [Clostridia bacterium]
MVFDEIRSALAEQLTIPEERISEDSLLIDDLKADSIDLYELVSGLEERYGIEISDDVLPTIKTVGDIVRYIESK